LGLSSFLTDPTTFNEQLGHICLVVGRSGIGGDRSAHLFCRGTVGRTYVHAGRRSRHAGLLAGFFSAIAQKRSRWSAGPSPQCAGRASPARSNSLFGRTCARARNRQPDRPRRSARRRACLATQAPRFRDRWRVRPRVHRGAPVENLGRKTLDALQEFGSQTGAPAGREKKNQRATAPADLASRAPRHPRTHLSTTAAAMPALPKMDLQRAATGVNLPK
jgi:hypothetical protein